MKARQADIDSRRRDSFIILMIFFAMTMLIWLVVTSETFYHMIGLTSYPPATSGEQMAVIICGLSVGWLSFIPAPGPRERESSVEQAPEHAGRRIPA